MPTKHPLVIYIAENNHSDMSYSSLLKQPRDEGAADEVKRFSGDKKAKEFEDIGSDSKKSWVDRILNSNQSRDDSVIKR